MLHRKAKAEPAFRFYPLYDKIYCKDIFRHAYTLARANAGVPGMDGMTFAAIEASGLDRWLAGLREELISKTASIRFRYHYPPHRVRPVRSQPYHRLSGKCVLYAVRVHV